MVALAERCAAARTLDAKISKLSGSWTFLYTTHVHVVRLPFEKLLCQTAARESSET